MIHIFELYSLASWPTTLTDSKGVYYIRSVKILLRNSNIQIWLTYSTWLKHSFPRINSRALNFFLLCFSKVLKKSEVNQWACSYIKISFIRSIVKYNFFFFCDQLQILKRIQFYIYIKLYIQWQPKFSFADGSKQSSKSAAICFIASHYISFLFQWFANCNLSIHFHLWQSIVFFSRDILYGFTTERINFCFLICLSRLKSQGTWTRISSRLFVF